MSAPATGFSDSLLRHADLKPDNVMVWAAPSADSVRFLLRQSPVIMEERVGFKGVVNSQFRTSRPEDSSPLVRLPSVKQSRWKVRVLARWTGRVEYVEDTTFAARISDANAPENPDEMVEMDISEVSSSDVPLLQPGAMFYWSIGYRDTEDGQRERVSTLRFARFSRISGSAIKKIWREADMLALAIESDV